MDDADELAERALPGLGRRQIDENAAPGEFALETAWGNVWESNGKIIDNMLAFIDYTYDASSSS